MNWVRIITEVAQIGCDIQWRKIKKLSRFSTTHSTSRQCQTRQTRYVMLNYLNFDITLCKRLLSRVCCIIGSHGYLLTYVYIYIQSLICFIPHTYPSRFATISDQFPVNWSTRHTFESLRFYTFARISFDMTCVFQHTNSFTRVTRNVSRTISLGNTDCAEENISAAVLEGMQNSNFFFAINVEIKVWMFVTLNF